jgi:alpha-mannosidase
MNVFDKGDATAVRKARKLAEEVFGEGWEAKGAGVYDEGPTEAQIWGIGEVFCPFCWFWGWDCANDDNIAFRTVSCAKDYVLC